MFLTAHSGANGTKPNGIEYFEAMKKFDVDIVEIDIQKLRKGYYLTHDRTLFPEKKGLLPLSYAMEYSKQNDVRINCDLKKEGYVAYLMDVAEEMGVIDKIIITGSAADREDRLAQRFGDLYVNSDYLPKLIPQNVREIKRILDDMGPFAKGINISFKKLPDDFLRACSDENVPVSLFTVDSEDLLKKYSAFPAIVNITTRNVTGAMKILGREAKK